MRGSAAPGFAPGFAAALAVLLVGLVAALALGRFPVFPLDLGRLLLAKLTGSASGLPPAVETVVWSIRGPRILAAVLVGTGERPGDPSAAAPTSEVSFVPLPAGSADPGTASPAPAGRPCVAPSMPSR